MEKRYTPENITALGKNEVFVFGSNLAGNHAGGAARVAREKFGAVMGQGVGLQGQSYAIPTMQGGIETIKPYVDEFIEFASKYYDKTFYVTRIGCGIAGFKDEDIAPLFEEAVDRLNIILPKSFVDIIRENNRVRNEALLTPWPVKNYGIYNLLIDLTLASNWETTDDRLSYLQRVCVTIGRSDIDVMPDDTCFDCFILHKEDILAGRKTLKILSTIADCLGFNNRKPYEAAFGRYFAAQAYHLVYLMFRTADYPRRLSIGFAQHGNFSYALFGTLTGRWNCGDNSYMYGDMETCAKFFINELNKHKTEISDDRKFDKAKFLTFVSQPYIWQYCHDHDNHKKTEVDMIWSVLTAVAHRGEYKYVGDYFVPTEDFPRPVYEVGDNRQRLHFPTYFLKEQFIKRMLTK